MSNPGVAFDSTLIKGERSPGVMNASLDGVPFRLNPDSIQLSFGVKTSRTETVGGIVIQVYGVNYSDLVLTGSFGIGGWQEQAAFLERMRAQGFKQSQRDSTGTFSYNLPVAQPMRFLFPSRGYDLMVYLKDYQSPDGQTVVHDNTIINPKWTLTLFIDNDNANLAKVAADAYIARLADGIGWTQTAFNGPVSSADTQAWLTAQEAAFGVTNAQDLFALISDPSAQLKLVDVAGTGTGTPPAPGGTGGSTDSNSLIMGPSVATAAQMHNYYFNVRQAGNGRLVGVTADDVIGYYLDEGKAQNIRGDVAWCQALKETGNYDSPDSALNNYAGIGHPDGVAHGTPFDSPRLGVRAHIQLLYKIANNSNTAPLANPNVAPSWGGKFVTTWEGLSQNWAYSPVPPVPTYAQSIMSIYAALLAQPTT